MAVTKPSTSNTSGLKYRDASAGGTKVADVPEAPIIGTATLVSGDPSVDVAFTVNPVGGVPTSFTATSSPGGLTGTASSSPVRVLNLEPGTSYTFTVTGTNSTGTGPASSASNSVSIPLPVPPTTLQYLVIAGGGSGGGPNNNAGNQGGTSSFGSITTVGGGGGASSNGGGGGGCGGGGGYSCYFGRAYAGGPGTANQGFDGSHGYSNSPGAGGGTGSSGGAGIASSITGTSVTYGQYGGSNPGFGGPTGGHNSCDTGGGGGAGGLRRNDGSPSGRNSAQEATFNVTTGTTYNVVVGSGGVNNSYPGNNGGKGKVIMRHASSAKTGTVTGSPTITISGGWKIYEWTGNGSVVWNA
jgi:hypothetical protein